MELSTITGSPLGLAILDLLLEHPMHPYEIKQTIRQRRLDDLVKMKGGSLYHAVERLLQAGLIEAVETERHGRRPERTVYRITEAGRDEFGDWLDEALSEVHNEYPRFGAAMAFMHDRDPKTVQRLLRDRVLRLTAEVAGLGRFLEAIAEYELPRANLIEWEYARAMRQAELEWVRSLADDIQSGSLTWEPHLSPAQTHECRHDGEEVRG
jgi:DNA-binding PadR family transcriptional regulator